MPSIAECKSLHGCDLRREGPARGPPRFTEGIEHRHDGSAVLVNAQHEKVSRTGGVLALRGGVVLDVRHMGKGSKPGSRAYKVRRFQGDWVSVQWERVSRAKTR